MSYTGELQRAMELLAAQPNAIFVGQGVGSPSTIQTDSLRTVPAERRIEFPVAEDLQLGFCIGLALEGYLPIAVFARWDFLLLAANQLVLHLDRIPMMSRGGFRPKVIIRVVAPAIESFNPGPQHDDDFTRAFREMFRTVSVICLPDEASIVRSYRDALQDDDPTVLVEYGGLYDAIPSGVMG